MITDLLSAEEQIVFAYLHGSFQELLVRDDSKRVEFEVATLNRYFDILPFRQRYLKELINDGGRENITC